MSRKRVMVQVTISDDETGRIEEQFMHDCGSVHAWEVERAFERLGRQMGEKCDPDYYK